MPTNGYNIGRDVVLDIVTDYGVLRPKITTEFESKQETHSIDVKPLNGAVLFDEIPAGWSGSFSLERGDPAVDDWIARREANYYLGAPTPNVTITETIAEVSGAISQYRYTGVSLKLDSAGVKKMDETIKMKIAFKASKRIKVA